ncbi:MAG: diguanylate cyclase [Eubacterium sp.]|nr:diguanylate cyclase [Eubacterium sp.]
MGEYMIFSLKKKTLILISLFSLVFGGAALFLCSYIVDDIVTADYTSKVRHLATATGHQIDGDKAAKIQKKVMKIYRHTENKVGSEEWGTPAFNEYISLFDDVTKMKEYTEIHDQMEGIQDDNEVSSVYLIYVDKETRNGIYLVDAAHDDPCPPGCFDPIYEVNYESLENPERGYPPYITNTEPYGWLITCAVAVKDSSGEVVCYAAVDASMTEIRAKQRKFFYLTGAVFLVLIILITVVGYVVINRYIVKPIRELSTAARKYCDTDLKSGKGGFSHIVVTSHDEIRELADSMKQMEYDLNEYISNLLRTREQLVRTRERAELMSEMANKDSLTGLRNKRAYEVDIERLTQEIQDGYARFGIVMVDMNYLKRMNDNYGHDKGDYALQKLTRMICDSFKHSPVYRFGGDEFVVIVENIDYRDVNELVRGFRESIDASDKNENLDPWERVSAAIGFAIYDEHRDKTVDDVFHRADDSMYEQKTKMKGGNPEER